jgi:class III poly(R)-hydroxyalkanoic acid synthase PhaE subunit
MTWSDQADSMMKVWTEAQKKMWENWYEMSQNMANPNAFAGFGMYDQWQTMASKWLETVNSNMEPAAQNLSRQFVSSQSTMMRFLEMTTKAWNVMMPRLDAGEDWEKVVSDYMESFRKQMFDPAQMMQAAQGSTALWTNSMQAMQSAMLPWMNPMQQAPGMMGAAMMSQNGGADIMDLTRMFWDAYHQTTGRMIGSPGVGFTRELEEKFSRAYQAWQKARQAMDEYQMLMADGWSGVMEQVLREMMNRAEKGQPVESIRDLIRLWTTAADKSFDRVFRSERYSEVQGQFLSTYMEYRIEEQKVFEEIMKYSYIPTRSEMDEAHRNIYELRKEVKMLKKAQRDTGKKAATPAKKPAAEPAKKPADAPKTASTPNTPEAPAN